MTAVVEADPVSMEIDEETPQDAVAEVARWIRISPDVLNDRECRLLLRRCARDLSHVQTDAATGGAIACVRDALVERARCIRGELAAPLIASVNVLCDLRAQGWQFRLTRSWIEVQAPVPGTGSVDEEKLRVRTAHLIERDAQLSQRSVRQFVRAMERPKLIRGEWVSVFSLMRDGRELADKLRFVEAITANDRRIRELSQVIDPYVQLVRAGITCEFTGLKVSDIWRYFRHTWSTTYQSTPGRKMYFIVRDRAAANHPVIGIGALGSAIVQLSVRDEWIGWTGNNFVQHLRSEPTTKWARWILDSLSSLVRALYLADFVSEGLISRSDLVNPTEETIERLRVFSAAERRTHHLFPDRGQHKRAPLNSDVYGGTNWKTQATTHLFRSKRALSLAELLDARRKLLHAGLRKDNLRCLQRVLQNRNAVSAIQTILRYMKAAHVGVNMMDITVCGAVAPYNDILGGKLVSVLMASPDVVSAYQNNYRGAASVIASSMAGKPVRRSPSLVLLGTTSLYGVGASQYNRIRVPAVEVGGSSKGNLAFVPLGKTIGYGSYHLSRGTMEAFDVVLRRQDSGRPVNSIFGEGVNPKLRKVRAALDEIGMPSDLLLQHGSARIVYAVALAENFRDVLLGRAVRPKYLIPQKPSTTKALADHWRVRWLSRRINRPGILDAVAVHTLAHPIRHGARVVLPTDPEEMGPLFAATT